MEKVKLKIKNQKSSQGCDCKSDPTTSIKDAYWISSNIKTTEGDIPQVKTTLTKEDYLGAIKVRFGIGRMNYKIDPGLYCVGVPTSSSNVFVTANYKLSFDSLRSELAGLNAWILILDTKGINVWCAAGKGTFGTAELVKRINKTKLAKIVTHKNIILPQLGAPGVAAHEVKKLTGFSVTYGPVRAKDIKTFISNGLKATASMRQVNFTFWDRLILTPVELKAASFTALIVFGVLFILNQIGLGPFGFTEFYSFIGAIFIGCVVTEVLLPFIPGKAFAFKGWLLGLIFILLVNFANGFSNSLEYSSLKALSYLLIFPSVSAFFAMNFTGCSTYTSFSGVIKEMKIAVPLIIGSIGLGSILLLLNNILNL